MRREICTRVNSASPARIGKLAVALAVGIIRDAPGGQRRQRDPTSTHDGRMFVATTRAPISSWSVRTGNRSNLTSIPTSSISQRSDHAADGTIYASDPHWKPTTGRSGGSAKSADGSIIGEKMTATRKMSTTTASISVPTADAYVGESDTGDLVVRIDGSRLLSAEAREAVRRFRHRRSAHDTSAISMWRGY